jgi:hypothetical protein
MVLLRAAAWLGDAMLTVSGQGRVGRNATPQVSGLGKGKGRRLDQ